MNLSALLSSRRGVGSSTSRSLLSTQPFFKTKGYTCTQLLGVLLCSWSENVKSHLYYVLKLQGSLTMDASSLKLHAPLTVHRFLNWQFSLSRISSTTADVRTKFWDLWTLCDDAFHRSWAEYVWSSLHAALAFCGILPITFALFWFVCLPSIPASMPLSTLQPPPFDSTFNPVTARIQLGSELVVAKPEILVPPLWEGSCCAYVFISSLFPVLEMVLQPIYVAYKTKGLTCFLSQWCKSDVKTLLLFPAIVCCKIFLCQL